jgi:hypothetical protein
VIINWTDRMLQATIRYVSVSDAVPLPRLGEVFFDVRGNSRSMRLSWYADTGVAVFSIWQAGMCTGTFRLPMADLSRMIEILERGPAPHGRGRAPVSAPPQGEDRGPDSDWYYEPAGDEQARPGAAGTPGEYGAEHAADYGRSGQGPDYGRGEPAPADYGAGSYGPGDGGDQAHAESDQARYQPAGYGPASYGGTVRDDDTRYYEGGYSSAGQGGGDDYRAPDYPADSRRDELAEGGGYPGGYEQSGYEQPGYEQPGYGQPDYEQPGYEQAGYEQAGYRSGGYGGAEADYQRSEHRSYPEERRPGADRGYTSAGAPGYDDERFVPPDVADGGQAYPNDNPAQGPGYQAHIGDAAFPADPRPVSRSERYLEPPAAEEAYSNGAEYRHR